MDDGAALHFRRRHAEHAGVVGGGRGDVLDRDVDTLDALHAVGVAARRLGVFRGQRDVRDTTARVDCGRIGGRIIARERDRLEALARGGRQLQVVAVVAGYAAVVDLEPDARVRGYPRAEVRDADRDVIDARKNGRASSREAGAEDSTSVGRGRASRDCGVAPVDNTGDPQRSAI